MQSIQLFSKDNILTWYGQRLIFGLANGSLEVQASVCQQDAEMGVSLKLLKWTFQVLLWV